ncbi:fimbrial protein [Shimwellia pseudoproteus]|uniref:fimbrial protein n=1 Tax=Shimwellia pseudoproteus TaxID=570012 RepID=UPI0018EBD4FA|nr:fimbrial protein [Shimwellia pseudoproteus]
MKLTKALMPAAIACALFSGNTLAVDLVPPAYSDNTVTFLGQVTDQTCVMTINGQEIKPVVLLPTVPRSDFSSKGDTTGETEFVVAVSGCTISEPSGTRADGDGVNDILYSGDAISTVFVAHEIADTNLLNVITPDAGGAKNVHIDILTPEAKGKSTIDFSKRYHGDGDLVLDAQGNASAVYTAQYIAHEAFDELSSGYVRASMQYALSYD